MQKKISSSFEKLCGKKQDAPENPQSISVGGNVDKANMIMGNNDQIILLVNDYAKTR